MSNIQIIDRVVAILQSFNVEQFELGLTELAKATGLSKSIVHRLATAMVQAELLNYDPQKRKYTPGITLFHLGNLIRRKLSLTMVARKYMIKLRDLTKESVLLKVVDKDQGVIIEFIEMEDAYMRLNSRLGQRTCMYAGASSKILLAYMLDEEIEQILEKGILRWTYCTPTVEQLRSEIGQIREQGYALSFGEIDLGGMGMAVPIFDSSQGVVASMSVIAPKYRLNEDKIREFLRYALEVGQEVSKELGFNPNLPIKLGKKDYYANLYNNGGR